MKYFEIAAFLLMIKQVFYRYLKLTKIYQESFVYIALAGRTKKVERI